MINIAFLLAFLSLPFVAFLIIRSVTWLTVYIFGATAIIGIVVSSGAIPPHDWDFHQLQVALLIALIAVVGAALLHRRGASPQRPATKIRRQLATVFLPASIILAVLALSRILAPPTGLGGPVGYFILNRGAEDNAKWLDFSSQLATGLPITQSVQTGGPLQLALVFVATFFAVVSLISLGGVNEVMVATNTVIYAQFMFVAAIPFALAPLAEARIRNRSNPSEESPASFIPAPAIWIGIVAMAAGSLGAIGLGHLTLQFVFLVLGLWMAVFLVGSPIPRGRILTSLAAASLATVWFPLAPVSVLILLGCGAWFVSAARRARDIRVVDPISFLLWLFVCLVLSEPLIGSLRYITDQPLITGMGVASGGGVSTATAIPALDLLESAGGTEVVAPALGLLVAASALLAALFVSRANHQLGRVQRSLLFAPALLLVAYDLALNLIGTWWAGAGPNYGASKTMFMTSIVLLSVSLPLAVMEVDRKRTGLTPVRVVSIIAVIFILTIDGLLPRALIRISPANYPLSAGVEKGYWWPAEVRSTSDQSIAANPIGCVYFPQGAPAPTALPDGQTAYSCTRLLAGLSGEDAGAQPVVDWLRREWLTNEAAWTAAWPGMIKMAPEVLDKQLILLDENNQVIGLESIRSLLDRIRPQWAEGQPLLEAKP